MKTLIILVKGIQKTTFVDLKNGKYEVISSTYLTCYEAWGCTSHRVVDKTEAMEIINRLQKKGFTLQYKTIKPAAI